MKRSVLFIALLLSVAPASAAPKNYGTITTREGKSFYECQVMHIYPDGVTFAHRNGAAKISFADLPENLRSEFRYDPKVEAEYQKEQAALRKAEQERQFPNPFVGGSADHWSGGWRAGVWRQLFALWLPDGLLRQRLLFRLWLPLLQRLLLIWRLPVLRQLFIRELPVLRWVFWNRLQPLCLR